MHKIYYLKKFTTVPIGEAKEAIVLASTGVEAGQLAGEYFADPFYSSCFEIDRSIKNKPHVIIMA
jgi:hypothetical protein